MRCISGFDSSARGGRVTALAVALALSACIPSAGPRAQSIPPDDAGTAVGHRVCDYFNRYTDPATADLLRTVERYHLAESFWSYYREGAFGSVRSDLLYVLSYFPNHPKALHIMAYDKNVDAEPSSVIQHFEAAIRTYPGHAYTYAQYGRYLLSIGRTSAGIALLDEALRLDPDLVVAQAWRAEEQSAHGGSQEEQPGTGPGKLKPPRSTENLPRRLR